MIRILIIEDELPSRKKLRRFIDELETPLQVVAELDTVLASIDFLKKESVDLIFSDIELLDGQAFEIYKHVPVSCPIIFTTAYDKFWMNAFESNGIEYLLKPFSQERFVQAWNKFKLLNKSVDADQDLLLKLKNILGGNADEGAYKKRLTISAHPGIYFLNIEDISFFEANEGVVFAFDIVGKKHLLNEATLKEIEAYLNPADFYRISRGHLVNKKHLERMERYTKNTLAVKMKGHEKLLSTSQSTTASFREWVEK